MGLGALLLVANAAGAAASSPGVPFYASFSGTGVLTSPYSAIFSGAGTALHMGSITTQGNAVVTGASDACPNGNTNTNTETLTAADGDTLTISSSDVGCPEGQLGFHGQGNWTVSAGTGRFAGVAGHGTFDGHSDFIAGTFEIQLDGTLGG
jgi:hypothetical protein